MAMDFPLRLGNTPSLTQVFTPVNVAILTSLGIHGFILGLALPYWQWQKPSEENLQDRSSVGVIELTPTEQSRLPDTNIFPSSSLFPTLPPGSDNATVPGDPNLPALPDSNYNYSLPPGQSIPPPPAMPNLPAYPNLPPLTSYGNLSRLPITNPPIPSLPQLSSSRPIPRPSGELPPPPGQWQNFTAPGLNRPNFGTLPPSQGTDFITRAPQSSNTAPEPGLTSEGDDTSPEKLRENTLVSIAQQGQAIKEKDSITGAYPPIACRNRTEATVVYNIFPSGQKDLVGRSRYPIFNQLAQQAIASRSYSQPTQVTVGFKYDPKICASVDQFVPPSNQTGGGTMMPMAPSSVTPPTSAPAQSTPPSSIAPSPEPLQSRPTQPSTNQTPKPSPTPAVKPAPVPDVPQPRPPAAATPKPAPTTPPPAATTPQPTNPQVDPPTPGPTAPPQGSLPKTKGDLLREENQAPSIVPPQPSTEESSETPTQSNVTTMENSLPAPMQSKK